jgi:CRISPR system Cascade subunit CasE
MSWLAKLEFKLSELEESKRKELMCNDSYSWHKKIWDCFSGSSEQKRDFLMRVDESDGIIVIWTRSEREPRCPSWCPNHCFKKRKISTSFLSHKYYIFDVKVNPIIALTQKNEDSLNTLRRKNGRHTLSKRVPLTNKNDLRKWLDNKGNRGGFVISDLEPLEISPAARIYFRKNLHGRNTTGYHSIVVFRGVLEVTDSKNFAHTYYNGIGSAKAFGFGLFLLAPLILEQSTLT